MLAFASLTLASRSSPKKPLTPFPGTPAGYFAPEMRSHRDVLATPVLYILWCTIHVEALSEIVHTLGPLPKARRYLHHQWFDSGPLRHLLESLVTTFCPAVWTELLLFSQAAGRTQIATG